MIKITDIHTNPDNPRKIDQKKFDELMNSIRTFPKMMELRPIITDEKGMIIGGNMRYKALRRLGYKEIPDEWVRPAADFTEEELKEFIIRDNVEFGEWDYDLLQDWDLVKLEEWGVQVPEDPDKGKAGKREDDDIPEEPPPVSKDGQIWILGDHRLAVGDATDPELMERLMNGTQADMVYTDPPYGVSYKGTKDPEGREWKIIKNDNLREDALYRLLFHSFSLVHKHTDGNPAVYCWHASRNQIIFETALIDAGFQVKEQLIWNKGMVLGRSDYHWSHEPLFYCRKQSANSQWFGDRKHKTILRQDPVELKKMKKDQLIQIIENLKKESTVWEMQKDSVRTYMHPTQKPVDLAARAIVNNTRPGQGVIDYFGGSGSTMIACEKLQRKCFMAELDPKYADVIIKRWENWTGQEAQVEKEKTTAQA